MRVHDIEWSPRFVDDRIAHALCSLGHAMATASQDTVPQTPMPKTPKRLFEWLSKLNAALAAHNPCESLAIEQGKGSATITLAYEYISQQGSKHTYTFIASHSGSGRTVIGADRVAYLKAAHGYKPKQVALLLRAIQRTERWYWKALERRKQRAQRIVERQYAYVTELTADAAIDNL